jgi:hypothetical protein
MRQILTWWTSFLDAAMYPSWWSDLTSLGNSLHGEFALQALAVASDSGHGERLSTAPE